MLLEATLREDIEKAINYHKKICTDHSNLTEIDIKYLSEIPKLEFLAEFMSIERLEDEKRRVIEKARLFEKITEHFAHYIGLRLAQALEKIYPGLELPAKAQILLGKSILDNY